MSIEPDVEPPTMHNLATARLTLVLESPVNVLQRIDAMPETDRALVSATWLAQVRAITEPDPWICGFTIALRETNVRVGACGFKGPPSAEGVVEIAYGIDEQHQGRGFATEAARGLAHFAFSDPRVRLVIAHTLPDGSASQRVLEKAGFRYVGDVVDPDDGVVQRWETGRTDHGSGHGSSA